MNAFLYLPGFLYTPTILALVFSLLLSGILGSRLYRQSGSRFMSALFSGSMFIIVYHIAFAVLLFVLSMQVSNFGSGVVMMQNGNIYVWIGVRIVGVIAAFIWIYSLQGVAPIGVKPFLLKVTPIIALAALSLFAFSIYISFIVGAQLQAEAADVKARLDMQRIQNDKIRPSGLKTYSSSVHNFTIQYPSGWSVTESKNTIQLVQGQLRQDAGSAITINLNADPTYKKYVNDWNEITAGGSYFSKSIYFDQGLYVYLAAEDEKTKAIEDQIASTLVFN